MTARLTLRPLGLTTAAPEGMPARPLAGGPLRFTACEAVVRPSPAPETWRRAVLPLDRIAPWLDGIGHGALGQPATALLDRLSAPRAAFAGLALDRPRIMGILNVTPDSFSDGGDRFDAGRAVADGLAMMEAGAAILDVGGESTRPGAEPVPVDEELRRTLPVVRALAEAGALVSIDTRHARVMAAAVEAGARLVNDVTALAGDADSLRAVAEAGVPVVLMHMRGEPRTMQVDPAYDDVALAVYDHLEARIAACEAAGIARARIAVDPGIGFGKTLVHNLRLLDHLALLHALGCPLVLGVSRKSFIAKVARGEAAKARLPGSLAAGLAGVARGAQVLRVHDVAETAQALAVWSAVEIGIGDA